MSTNAGTKDPETSGAVNLSDASREELQALIDSLVKAGDVEAKIVGRKLSGIRRRTARLAKVAANPASLQTAADASSGLPERMLEPEDAERLIKTLTDRFETNMDRHKGIQWGLVQKRLEAQPEKLWSLNEMERTGGEPDVVGFDKKTGEYIFMDCSVESPEGRRNVCYDREGQELAEKYGRYPAGNAVDIAKDMGIEVLTEAEYRELQKQGKFDLNSWSWLKTPANIRKSRDALRGRCSNDLGDVYRDDAHLHNDYGAFRGSLRV